MNHHNHKIGIVGCGRRMEALINNMGELRSRFPIAALCDIDRAAAERFRAEFAPEAAICPDYDAMLADASLDWIMVVTPNHTHAELVCRAFRAGKNVFSEKPMAVSAEECRAIRDAWKNSGRNYMIGFTLRYSPHYRKIREIVRSGLLGSVVSFECNENVPPEHGGHICSCWRRNRATTGFHLLEKCCHDIDIINWILDSEPVRVASFGGLSSFREEHAGLLDRYRDPDGGSVYCRWPTAKGKNPFLTDKDIVDNQVCILEYAAGMRGTFHTNINCPINERRMYIAGTEGTLRADAITGMIEVRTADGTLSDYPSGVRGSHAGGDRILLEKLLEQIEGAPCDESDIAAGLLSAEVCFALDRAMRDGSVVTRSLE